MIKTPKRWQKLPSDPLTHDQWVLAGQKAFVRQIDEATYFVYARRGEHHVHIKTYTSLNSAKKYAEKFVEVKAA